MSKNKFNNLPCFRDLYEAAKAKGITQQDLANKTGMNKAVISRFFSPQSNPTMKTFQSIAKAAGYEISITPIEPDTSKL